jgi:hypothetical protein
MDLIYNLREVAYCTAYRIRHSRHTYASTPSRQNKTESKHIILSIRMNLSHETNPSSHSTDQVLSLNAKTNGLDIVKAFPDQVRGKICRLPNEQPLANAPLD